MNRVDAVFAGGRRALVGYLPLGDPAVPEDLARVYADCGVDVLEVGVPARAPFLDGPTVAGSMARALAAGVRPAEALAELRQALPEQAMVWMGYPERPLSDLAAEAAAAGVDAVLVPVPARTLAPLREALERRRIHLVHFLGAPPHEADVAEAGSARGYVMVQAAAGVTGSRASLGEWARGLARLREAGVAAPLAVGFGISTAVQVRQALSLGADAVVVGSALVEAALDGRGRLEALLRELRRVVDGA